MSFENIDMLLGVHDTLAAHVLTSRNPDMICQKEEFQLDMRHLTLASPPTSAFTLEIVTEIYPQNNTSLEVQIISKS